MKNRLIISATVVGPAFVGRTGNKREEGVLIIRAHENYCCPETGLPDDIAIKIY